MFLKYWKSKKLTQTVYNYFENLCNRQGEISTSCNGTKGPYMSPQVCVEDKYTTKADIWSIGVLFLKIIIKRGSRKVAEIKPAKFVKLETSDLKEHVNSGMDIKRSMPKNSTITESSLDEAKGGNAQSWKIGFENPIYELLEVICTKMVVKEEEDRATVKQIIVLDVFKEHYKVAKSEADKWLEERRKAKKSPEQPESHSMVISLELFQFLLIIQLKQLMIFLQSPEFQNTFCQFSARREQSKRQPNTNQ